MQGIHYASRSDDPRVRSGFFDSSRLMDDCLEGFENLKQSRSEMKSHSLSWGQRSKGWSHCVCLRCLVICWLAGTRPLHAPFRRLIIRETTKMAASSKGCTARTRDQISIHLDLIEEYWMVIQAKYDPITAGHRRDLQVNRNVWTSIGLA